MRSPLGYLILCLLSIALLGPATAFSGQVCDDEILPVAALLRLLKAGLGTGDLELNLLRGYVEQPQLDNPYQQSGRSVENLFLANKFSIYLHQLHELPATAAERFRKRARELVQQESVKKGLVDSAKEETADILGAQITENFDGRILIGAVVKGTLQGRPIFVTLEKINNDIGRFTLLDPTHPEKSERISHFGPEFDPTARFGGVIFYQDGRTYYFDSLGSKTYDLESKVEGPFAWPTVKKIEGPQCMVAFPVGDTVRAVTFSEQRLQSLGHLDILTYFDLSESNPEPKEFFRGTSADFLGMPLYNLGGRIILPTTPAHTDDTVRFFDLIQPEKPFANFAPVKGEISFKSDYSPMPYAIGDEWFAIIRYTNEKLRKDRVGIFNLREQRHIVDIDTGAHNPSFLNRPDFVEVNGSPTALLHFNHGLIVLDLITQQNLWSLDSNMRAFDIFEWRGKKYLVGVSESTADLEVFELDTGIVRAKKPVPPSPISQVSDVKKVVAFQENGVPMAIVIRNFGAGFFFVKLLEREQKP